MGQGKGRRVPVEIPRIRKLRWCLTDVHWRWSDRRRCVQGNNLFPFESPPLFTPTAHDYNNNTFCIFCSTRAWVSGARRWKLNQVLRDRGHGVGIVVSKVPKETSASYSLQEPSEVYTIHIYIYCLITSMSICLISAVHLIISSVFF